MLGSLEKQPIADSSLVATSISLLFRNAAYMHGHFLIPSFSSGWVKAYLEKEEPLLNAGLFTEILEKSSDYMQENGVYDIMRALPDLAVAMVPSALKDFPFGRARFYFEMAAFAFTNFTQIRQNTGMADIYHVELLEKTNKKQIRTEALCQ